MEFKEVVMLLAGLYIMMAGIVRIISNRRQQNDRGFLANIALLPMAFIANIVMILATGLWLVWSLTKGFNVLIIIFGLFLIVYYKEAWIGFQDISEIEMFLTTMFLNLVVATHINELEGINGLAQE